MDDRRRQILDAALGAFLARGYGATTIADIRRLSGASTGSIYHFFPGKAAIAEALVVQAVAGWSAAAPQAGAAEAEIAIKASVRGLLDWGLANPRLLLLLDELRLLGQGDAQKLQAVFDAGQAAAASRYAAWAKAGLVKPLAWPMAHALMLGPAYDFLRFASRGKAGPQPDAAPALLADAAWDAVRAR